MAKSRKDNKGRVLQKGESYRSSDGKYQYAYADEAGKRRYIYSKNLTAELHEAKMKNREPLILPHFTCHSLRHTFCARFCENENNLKVIQTVMGHDVRLNGTE